MNRIDECKKSYKSWCSFLGVTSVEDINRIAASRELTDIINISEARHEQELSEIARRIKDEGRRIVLIAGPSGAGKTTASQRLKFHLAALGIHSVPISLDNYYLDKSLMPKNDDGEPDFESLGSIDYKLFNKNIASLTDGVETVLPVFDFKLARMIPDGKTLSLKSDSVIITEGIHGLNPLIADNIPDSMKFRLYCTPLSVMEDTDGKKISSQTIRMVRRLIRDYYFRNSDYQVTFSLWQNQEKSAEKNIFPYTDTADIVFNTSLPYELAVYKPHLLDVLAPAKENDCDIEKIKYMRRLAAEFETISREFVPMNSIIREFVGKSSIKYT